MSNADPHRPRGASGQAFDVQPLPAPGFPLPPTAQPPLPASAMPAQPPTPLPNIVIQTAPVRAASAAPAAAHPKVTIALPGKDQSHPLGKIAPSVEEREDQPDPDVAAKAVRSAPPWMVSMVIHMALIIVLALITIPRIAKSQIELQAAYGESLGRQLIDDKLQSPAALDMQVEVPVLSFDVKPSDDPLAAPPRLSDNFLDATRATSMLDAPSIGLALTGREAGMKKALLGAYGGNATTEDSVVLGLQWLKRQQAKDGSWSLSGPFPDGAVTDNRVSATAMALLAFQGYGSTHKPNSGTTQDFHDVVQKGWDYLLKQQNADGYFVQEVSSLNHRLYAQAQATIAICEIYGMTKDEKFKKSAQLALDFAHKAQSPEFGGWRYEPRVDSDTSVTGWYVMALQSGMMAGLSVQSPTLSAVSSFLDRVSSEGGTRYAYQIGREPDLVMTAEALLCRQYLGWKHDDPRMRAGIEYLLGNPVSYSDQNVYYWYYATQACHHMDGDEWNRWNRVMRQAIPTAQTKTGNDRGSWASGADRWGPHGGRLYVTCLSIYMLEVYYRHLPIYKWRLQ